MEKIEDLGHWLYSGEVPVDTYGFVYLITNTVSGRKYVGKKQMQSVRKLKPLRGKTNKRRKIVDTDWRTYAGSSDDLLSDIIALGEQLFRFEILYLCSCKWEMSYFEAKYQFEHNVLLTEDYYNGIINLRVGKAPKSFREKK